MARYFLAYIGGGGMAPTPEEQEKVMAAWGAWMGGLGQKLVDPGAPVMGKTSVTGGGSAEGTTSGFGGWSVVNADSLEDAEAAARSCPHIAAGGTVEVSEVIEMQ
jgi:hypothetical protein